VNTRFIFFDLDHTLWDYERNADETLEHMFIHFNLQQIAEGDAALFKQIYHEVNRRMWSEYDRGLITKETLRHQRFVEVLLRMKVPAHEVPNGMWEMFLELCPQKTHLMPGAIETLQYLSNRYPMGIITNGFERTQHVKIQSSGLSPFFKEVVTSEALGIPKPRPEIFHEMLARFDAKASECIMIGDNELNDVQGALNAGIESIHYHPHTPKCSSLAKMCIQELLELKKLL
jgi:putative hydrolase of the HAD superfamily